jgi:ABC-type transport system involved in cytochrome bd biosynthesis fused ATPase/permease subunit
MTELAVRGDIEETLGGSSHGPTTSPNTNSKAVLPLRQMPHDQVSNKASMFSARPAKDLEWKNINFRVGNKLQVLSNCWGSVRHGKVCAILGPSGHIFLSASLSSLSLSFC